MMARRFIPSMLLVLATLLLGGCGGGGGQNTFIGSGLSTIDTAIDWLFGGDADEADTEAADLATPADILGDGTPEFAVEAFADEEAREALDLAALEAVFAIVEDVDELAEGDFATSNISSRFPPKLPGVYRAAVLLPLSGQFQALGVELRQAVDLAVFSLQLPRFEVIFIDSQPRANEAALAAVAAGADMIIGPVFASETNAVVPIAANHGLPVLSFSNTAGVSAYGAWILGQRPEQEIDAAMRYALYELLREKGVAVSEARVAIISDESNYGWKLGLYSKDWLVKMGVRKISSLALFNEDLANEANVRQVVQGFIGWEDGAPVISNETLAVLAADPPLLAAAEASFEEHGLPAPFDIVLFCGSTDFTLRVAPVLVWHDLDPGDNVRFVGTSQWNRLEAVSEPSLQGGLFAAAPQENHARFADTWQKYYPRQASPLAPLGYDAVAIASMLASDQHRNQLLQQGIDFVGFSGAFRLMPDGSNDRQVELRRIESGGSEAIPISPGLEADIAAALDTLTRRLPRSRRRSNRVRAF